jgi:D-alanine-D-alanine ligase
MGGPSSEREVSLHSGEAVARGLRQAGHDVVEVDVRGHELELGDDVEAVFIALHGEFGEDGQVQALLDERGIPYTGSGAEASRAAFDKVISKKIFVDNGICTPAYEVVRNGDGRSLPLPLVVKPARQGSTIGVHRVVADSGWDDAVRDALVYGTDAIVEDYIEGRELTVGIVDGEALPVVEIVAPEGWYDYRAKYEKGHTTYIVPAELDRETNDTCRDLAVKTFRALGCRGFGRVDMRFSESRGVYVLELNTIPGFTETSLLPKAAAEAGLDFAALCSRIMDMAAVG